MTSSTWTFADAAGRAWWGGMWADRVRQSAFATQASSYGLSTEAELADLAAGWREWIDERDGVFVVPSVEVLARDRPMRIECFVRGLPARNTPMHQTLGWGRQGRSRMTTERGATS